MSNSIGTQVLTNYISRKTGQNFHGSELSYFDRFKSGLYEKVRSYQCNQNMPYWNKKLNHENGKTFFVIVRSKYNKEEFVASVEKVN